MNNKKNLSLDDFIDSTEKVLGAAVEESHAKVVTKEIGYITKVSSAIVIANGLSGVGADECVMVSGKYTGVVAGFGKEGTKIILLDKTSEIKAGDEVVRTHESLNTTVGEAMIGRVVDGLGRVVDGLEELPQLEKMEVERPAYSILDRAVVDTPLETGIKVIDALIPVGRGQRELILGDRQTGKTAVAVDTIIHQKGKNVICIYCAIGQRESAVAHVLEDLRSSGAMEYTIIVKARGDDMPGLQYITPYAATSMAEYFMLQGKDVLIIYDDLTRHARAYRELSLLLERAPGREAFPGDIFYTHSRLLERSTHLKKELGGGSITSLPVIETEAQNLSAYIPTNLISITDGQIYLSPELFQKGQLPAVDVGRSVSRVGGKAQVKAYKAIAGDLGISYSQFEELEMFSRFATKLDDVTRQIINRGNKLRAILKQARYDTIPTEEQVAIVLAVSNGLFDDLEDDKVSEAEKTVRKIMKEQYIELGKSIRANNKIDEKDREDLLLDLRKSLGVK